jgi:tetratricopeptide (TPR) repeat protein
MISNQTRYRNHYGGNVCYNDGIYREILKKLNLSLKKDPENTYLIILKGNVLINLCRYAKAYECFSKVLIHANMIDLIDDYVEKYNAHLEGDVENLLDLLNNKYNIPITLDGLNLVLKKVREDHNKYRKVKEWQDFKKSLQRKHQAPLEEYMYLFLQRFGESFYKHFIRFYCYLYEHNIINLTMNQFATILMGHRKKMKLDQFERFLKTGRKQPLLDRMTGTDFVNFLADFFENKGYHVRKNPPTHDFGADLIVDRFEETIAVQAKCRKQTVGITAVQEVHGARDYYPTRRAMVISVGGFTNPAVKLANRLGVELWDRKRLLDEIKKFGF